MFKIFKRCILGLAVLWIIILCISQIKILMFNDISVEPISKEDNPEVVPELPVKRPPVYLISYAGGKEIWFKNQNALALSALNKGVDFILNYRPSLLEPEFVKKNAHIFKHKNGAGYWLWKPYIILKTMRELPENAIIIYADTGSVFRGSLKPILDKIQHHDIILYNYGDHLKQIASHYALSKTNCDTDACRHSPHVWAGFIVLRNTSTARTFIERWLRYCEDEALLTGSINLPPKDPAFTHHQHDEALLGIVYHQLPKGVLALLPEAFPFLCWHHRIPGSEYKTLMPRMKKQINGVEQRFLNSTTITAIREFFLSRFFTNRFEPKPSRKD